MSGMLMTRWIEEVIIFCYLRKNVAFPSATTSSRRRSVTAGTGKFAAESFVAGPKMFSKNSVKHIVVTLGKRCVLQIQNVQAEKKMWDSAGSVDSGVQGQGGFGAPQKVGISAGREDEWRL